MGLCFSLQHSKRYQVLHSLSSGYSVYLHQFQKVRKFQTSLGSRRSVWIKCIFTQMDHGGSPPLSHSGLIICFPSLFYSFNISHDLTWSCCFQSFFHLKCFHLFIGLQSPCFMWGHFSMPSSGVSQLRCFSLCFVTPVKNDRLSISSVWVLSKSKGSTEVLIHY